jgi:MFS family permease
MAKSAGREFLRSVKLLATRRFGTFWVASLLSNIGTWAQQIAEPWLLLSLGAAPFLIGLDSFARNAPIWALTLAGGVLADRADRRQIIALFESIQMKCPALIVVLLLNGRVHPYIIIALSLVVGVTDALSMPSYQSIVPSIVPRAEISRGLALNSTQFNLSRILGPAIAGVLMASVGAVACFSLSAASYIPFIGVALWILPRGRSRRRPVGLDAGHLLSAFSQTLRPGPSQGRVADGVGDERPVRTADYLHAGAGITGVSRRFQSVQRGRRRLRNWRPHRRGWAHDHPP